MPVAMAMSRPTGDQMGEITSSYRGAIGPLYTFALAVREMDHVHAHAGLMQAVSVEKSRSVRRPPGREDIAAGFNEGG